MKHDKLTFWEFTFLGLLEWNYFESKGDRKFSCKNIDRVRTLAKGMNYIIIICMSAILIALQVNGVSEMLFGSMTNFKTVGTLFLAANLTTVVFYGRLLISYFPYRAGVFITIPRDEELSLKAKRQKIVLSILNWIPIILWVWILLAVSI